MRPDQYYTDVIARPMSVLGRRSGQAAGGQGREVEVIAEEEQQFLMRQQQYLAQGLPPNQGAGMPPGVQKTPDRKVVGSPGVQGSPKKVIYKSTNSLTNSLNKLLILVETWSKFANNVDNSN